jgi:hypothetical protein
VVDIQVRAKRRFQAFALTSPNFESLLIRTRLTDEEVARSLSAFVFRE